MSVLEFLVKDMVTNWKFEHEKDQELLALINDSCEVYIVADGLDEADDELFSSPLDANSQMGLYNKATSDVIIKNLLAGRILPKAKKVITSRPDAFLNLHSDFKPNFNVRVLGLNLESQKALGLLLCNKSDAEYSKVEEKLDANPDLRAFCYNPLQCSITVQVLMNKQISETDSRIMSALILVENLLCMFRRNKHLQDELHDTVGGLAELAMQGMKDDRFIFEKEELTDLKRETLKQFFLSKTASIRRPGENILKGEKKFFFTHLLWQEFFAAMWLMFVSDEKQFRDSTEDLSGNRWRVVLPFTFGLQNNVVAEKIVVLFESFKGKSDDSLFCNKCKALRKFHYNAVDHGSTMEACRPALEAKQPSLDENVAERLPTSSILPPTPTQSRACATDHAFNIESSTEHSSTSNEATLQGDSPQILMNEVIVD